jgi:hypothetical protein
MKASPHRKTWQFISCTVVLLVFALGHTAFAQGVCDGYTDACAVPQSLCSDGGFQISLKSFVPGSASNDGTASYTYEVCSPAAGICQGGNGLRAGESCLDDSFCQRKGQTNDPNATCSRTCSVSAFRGLSHFDVAFPQLGASCVSQGSQVTGRCSNGTGFVLGDGSCFDGSTSNSFIAKCDGTNLAPGQCLTMTINIAGENTGLGLGAAVVVDKESNTCTSSCIAGPSCAACDTQEDGDQCLTRTRGFWGTHPHIASQFLPVTVCGETINTTEAGACSTSEALCTSANDYKKNPEYLTLVAQLTAAKLNLNATAALGESGASCASYPRIGERTIQEFIQYCETNFCGASKAAISGSTCLELLDAFNNSQDVGFETTPAPFDAPGPAQPAQCQAARGNNKAIGVNLCN